LNSIHPNAKLGKGTIIGEFSIIHDKVTLGDNVIVCSLVEIGAQPVSYSNDKLVKGMYGVRIGNNCVFHSGTKVVLGTERDTIIGKDSHFGQNAIIGHDSIIGEKVNFMNSAVANGFVEVGSLTMIGCGAFIRNRIKIGKNVIIGMGSNVLEDISDNVVAFGNPCKVQRKNDGDVKFILKQFMIGV